MIISKTRVRKKCIRNFHMKEDNRIAFSEGSVYVMTRIEYEEGVDYSTRNDQNGPHSLPEEDVNNFFEDAPETVLIMPKWAAIMDTIIHVLEEGSEEAKRPLRDELKELAVNADKSNQRGWMIEHGQEMLSVLNELQSYFLDKPHLRHNSEVKRLNQLIQDVETSQFEHERKFGKVE